VRSEVDDAAEPALPDGVRRARPSVSEDRAAVVVGELVSRTRDRERGVVVCFVVLCVRAVAALVVATLVGRPWSAAPVIVPALTTAVFIATARIRLDE